MKFLLGRRETRRSESSARDADMDRENDSWRSIRYGFDGVGRVEDHPDGAVASPASARAPETRSTHPAHHHASSPRPLASALVTADSATVSQPSDRHCAANSRYGALPDTPSPVLLTYEGDAAAQPPIPFRRARQAMFFAVGLLFGSISIYACQSLATYLDGPTTERLAASVRDFVGRFDFPIVADWFGAENDATASEAGGERRSPALAGLEISGSETGAQPSFDGGPENIRLLSASNGVSPLAAPSAHDDAIAPSTVSRSLTTDSAERRYLDSGVDRGSLGFGSGTEGDGTASPPNLSGGIAVQQDALPGAGPQAAQPESGTTHCRAVRFGGGDETWQQPISLDRVEVRVAHSWAHDAPTAQRECERRLDGIASLCQRQGGEIVGRRPRCDCVLVSSSDGTDVPLFRCNYTNGEEFACSFSAATAASRRLICD